MAFFKNRAKNCCPECTDSPCDECETCTATLSCQVATAGKKQCGFFGYFLDGLGDVACGGEGATPDILIYRTRTITLTGGLPCLSETCAAGGTAILTYDRATCDVSQSGTFPCREDSEWNYLTTTDSCEHGATLHSQTNFTAPLCEEGDDGQDWTLSDEYTPAMFHADVDALVAAAEYAVSPDCFAHKFTDESPEGFPQITITKLLYTITTHLPSQCVQFKIRFTPAGGGEPTYTAREETTGDVIPIFVEEIIPLADDPDGTWDVVDLVCCPVIGDV